METDYSYLYESYPEIISADQLYRICHISKRKAKWLLDSGRIPCQDSGKKTRRYKIRTDDVVSYLRMLETAPETVAAPVGLFNSKSKRINPIAQIDINDFQHFLYRIWAMEPDALTPKDIRPLIGYSPSTIGQWIACQKLQNTTLPDRTQIIAKSGLWSSFRNIPSGIPTGCPIPIDRLQEGTWKNSKSDANLTAIPGHQIGAFSFSKQAKRRINK